MRTREMLSDIFLKELWCAINQRRKQRAKTDLTIVSLEMTVQIIHRVGTVRLFPRETENVPEEF